ncbi:folate-binding protein YgfZ [Beijerinckia sp. L45]|uniref:CAF17-like 4Fe-4S cluster assembly/insertion protein YgfZ n=1 Tax=Beijerinckia sp. L45 TaxID=1641855 RepID=UPI00131C349F|nr:folate-binding protein [Beijerinckia sp. L45]
MTRCLLADRGVIAVSGEDAESFLNRMFTNSVLDMPPGSARFAGLLSPQGKLLFDFFVVKQADGFLVDCVRAQAAELAKKLMMFRLRAKVVITDRSDELAVAAVWDSVLMEAPGPAFRDPRHNALGYRIVAPVAAAHIFDDPDGPAAYEVHRIACGVPKGGVDFPYGDTFVHDANMDLLHGVDFGKGCYVGQEVVSRVHHRNTARKRVVRLNFYGDAPAVGATVEAAGTVLGALTSLAGREGLATLRIDRLADAEAARTPITVNETLVSISLPSHSVIEPPAYAEDLYD